MDFCNCGCTAGYVWGCVLGWDRGANVSRWSFSRTRTRLRGKGLKCRHRAKERKRWICGGVEGAPYRRAKRDVGVWVWSAGDRLAGGHFAPVGPPQPTEVGEGFLNMHVARFCIFAGRARAPRARAHARKSLVGPPNTGAQVVRAFWGGSPM
jgi:hypothetical protein